MLWYSVYFALKGRDDNKNYERKTKEQRRKERLERECKEREELEKKQQRKQRRLLRELSAIPMEKQTSLAARRRIVQLRPGNRLVDDNFDSSSDEDTQGYTPTPTIQPELNKNAEFGEMNSGSKGNQTERGLLATETLQTERTPEPTELSMKGDTDSKRSNLEIRKKHKFEE